MKVEARHDRQFWGQLASLPPTDSLRPQSCPFARICSTAVATSDISAKRFATRERKCRTILLSFISPAFVSSLSIGSVVADPRNGIVVRVLCTVRVSCCRHVADYSGWFAHDLNPPSATHQLPSLPLDSKTDKVRARHDRAQVLARCITWQGNRTTANLADAPSWAISAGISRAAAEDGRISRSVSDTGICCRSDVAADPAVWL